MARIANIHRKTNETDIRVRLNLDGRGKARVSTGVRFFDHMLELLAESLSHRFAQCDSCIFHGVVLVHIQVAAGDQFKIEGAVAGK